MSQQAEAIRNALDDLTGEGFGLLELLDIEALRRNYQRWYSRSLAVVRQLLPDRVDEFTLLYEGTNEENGIRYDLMGYAASTWPREKLETQACIVESAAQRLDDILNNLRGLLQAHLFDSELDAARELSKNGHVRAAGAVAGVVLEGHLAQVCANHAVEVKKEQATISALNEALKNAELLDVPQWRGIQRLADIRNFCTHKKSREPTADEVQELIDGVDKAIKTLS